ncbi:MAG: KamA family radical SAM protein [Kiritimatiellae bacterium]|jgi:lysine 2,3-aminomutase|nr:KamA family radical SAM protein [Kiritimatiellia bacterium]
MLDINNQNWNNWQWQLKNAVGFTELPALFPKHDFSGCSAVDSLFTVKISPYYLDLLRKENGKGPLSRMALPHIAELMSGGFSADPFGEEQGASRCYGVKQRFPDRALIMVSGSCTMNCRHCTRKGLLGSAEIVCSSEHIKQAVEFIESKPLIREVLLSGGDPLMLQDESIIDLVAVFAGLPQIDAVRIGTRVPVTLPFRVTPELAGELGSSLKVWINTQFNHVSEITREAEKACCLLVEAGVPVSNQSVLLCGVNDSSDAMFDLCSGLQRIRVRPYYVFLCDPIAGIDHFRVSKERAVKIESELAVRLGGLALPRFVEDIPGAERKVPI